MKSLHSQLLDAIDNDDVETASRIVANEIDLNIPCEDLQGAPALFFAVLKGNYSMIRLLLERGADPNHPAEEPAASIYSDYPLELAQDARMLYDWEKYQAIIDLLLQFGAIGESEPMTSPELLIRRREEARAWQKKKDRS